MTNHTHPKRILALDLRPRSFGYAVFEGAQDLLDWGVRSFRRGRNAVRIPAEKKLARLLDEFVPHVVVLKQGDGWKKKGSANPARILRAVIEQAEARRIPVRCLPRSVIQEGFGTPDRATKHDIATLVSNRFPELSWRLPPKRKCWQSEDYRMSIFDAAALGFAYFARHASCGPAAPTADSDSP